MIISNLFKSSVGKKLIVAVTGIGLGLFLLVHMAGNLQVYLGRDAINGYAAGLHSHPGLVWFFRIGLLTFFLLHVILVITLTLRNSAARPGAYKCKNTIQASIASRTMIYTGILILVFLVYHILHFTMGMVQNDYFSQIDTQGRHDVYHMVVNGFRQMPVLIGYAAALFFLGTHLYHGAGSVFQSLGMVKQSAYPLVKKIGILAMLVVVAGLVSVPAGIALGIIRV